LSNKLAEELKLEGSMDEGMEIPASIQDYLEKGPFKVSKQRILLIFRSLIFLALMRSFLPATTDPRRKFILYLTNISITVAFSISAAQFDNDVEDDYNWDEEGEDSSGGGEGGLVNEDPDVPTVDSNSGRVMSKPRKSGSPLEWLLGAKMSGFGAGETVAKKNKKGGKKYDAEPEEEEFPEEEQYE
jgi:hypothetical protein